MTLSKNDKVGPGRPVVNGAVRSQMTKRDFFARFVT